MDTNYVIFDYSEIDKVDFNQVKESSIDTLRITNDGLKTFVKWSGVEPDFISTLTSKSIIYNNEEIIEILSQPEWYPLPDTLSGTTIN
jgi:hypothetical protein